MPAISDPCAGVGIKPHQVAFDIDGVVADTMRLFIDIGRELYDVGHIRYEDMTAYHLGECLDLSQDLIDAIIDRILTGDYPCELAPIPGARDVLRRLGACGPVLFVTARPDPGPMTAWMNDLLPADEFQVEMVATGSFESKADVLVSRGIDFFVEDRLDTCFLLNERRISPILFRQPWNRQPHAFVEVETWPQLAALLDFC